MTYGALRFTALSVEDRLTDLISASQLLWLAHTRDFDTMARVLVEKATHPLPDRPSPDLPALEAQTLRNLFRATVAGGEELLLRHLERPFILEEREGHTDRSLAALPEARRRLKVLREQQWPDSRPEQLRMLEESLPQILGSLTAEMPIGPLLFVPTDELERVMREMTTPEINGSLAQALHLHRVAKPVERLERPILDDIRERVFKTQLWPRCRLIYLLDPDELRNRIRVLLTDCQPELGDSAITKQVTSYANWLESGTVDYPGPANSTRANAAWSAREKPRA
jgi:hypothetical protein